MSEKIIVHAPLTQGVIRAYRDVIAHEVPVAFLSIKLHRESTHIPQALRRPAWKAHYVSAFSHSIHMVLSEKQTRIEFAH